MTERAELAQCKRVVVKIGSRLLADSPAARPAAIADQVVELRRRGVEVIVVSSGAIALGIRRLALPGRPHDLPALQAAAAVGQSLLMQHWEHAFAAHGLAIGQVLVTHDDLGDRRRFLSARLTLRALLDHGVVPIINENDTVVTDEIKFGDNDTLGALVANLVEADALVILTDQQGLYTADPRREASATLIQEGRADDRRYEVMAGGAGSGIGKGGMITKVQAARRAARSGAHTLIISGHEKNGLLRAAHGEAIGTLLYAIESPLTARKQWLADHLQLAGGLTLDDGAVAALKGGRSLLAIGVKSVDGEFERGAAVACRATDGREIARGLINYPSSEARRIAGHGTAEIEILLGYIDEDELIHRDNLVLL
jgi:glutamate 5-kinase